MVAILVVIVVVSALVGFAATHVVRRHDRAPAEAVVIPPLPSALVAATGTPSAIPTDPSPQGSGNPQALAASVTALLADPRLGGRLLAAVSDVDGGDVLLAHSPSVTAAPASTAEIATAVAVLAVHAPTDRITTEVRLGTTPGTVVLTGAGDPTLSAASVNQATPYADAARLLDLATQVRASGTRVDQIIVDDSLFSGPAVSPSWLPGDVPSGYESGITALMADGGRGSPTVDLRSSNPAGSAGAALARDLGLAPTAVTVSTLPM